MVLSCVGDKELRYPPSASAAMGPRALQLLPSSVLQGEGRTSHRLSHTQFDIAPSNPSSC